jgi:hypothetical protein
VIEQTATFTLRGGPCDGQQITLPISKYGYPEPVISVNPRGTERAMYFRHCFRSESGYDRYEFHDSPQVT